MASSHSVGDDGVVGRAAQIQQLVEPEAQGGKHRSVKTLGRPSGEPLDEVVERALSLDGAVGQAHRQRAIARIELAGLGKERLVGVGAVLEHASQHRVGAAARGRDGGG